MPVKLSKIEFNNFRCFQSEVIEFGSYNSLVGPNNCGKSTVLAALNIFFSDGARQPKITPGDFYIGAPDECELSIKYHFENISGELEKSLSHYVRSGKVIFEILAKRSIGGGIETKCRGVRYGLPEIAPFFAASKAGEKRPIYEELRKANPGKLPPWEKMEQATEAVRTYELSRATEHQQIPSEDSAYGATGPQPILKQYIDWIYIPAVKEASTEADDQRNSAFSKLVMLAVRSKCDFSEKIESIKTGASLELKKVLDGAEDILEELSKEIDYDFKRLTTTPIDVGLRWGEIDSISVKEPAIISQFKDGSVFGAPDSFGHRIQRTYIMALLGLLAKTQNASRDFQLLLGIEEPELYQHPPQAKYLAEALLDISGENCQIIITTHSPTFISGRTFESIRLLRKDANKTKVQTWTIDEQRKYCAARLEKKPIGERAALSGLDRTLHTNIAEMFFTKKAILVEGIEDCALIEAYLRHTGSFNNFLRSGGHIVPTGGKPKMPMLIALARGFAIETYCVFDMDENRESNLQLCQYVKDTEDDIHADKFEEYQGKHFFCWPKNIQTSISDECKEWADTMTEVADEWGWTADRMEKDPMLLDEVIGRLIERGIKIEALNRLTKAIIDFADR